MENEIDLLVLELGDVQELRRLLQHGLDPNKYVNLSPLIRYATNYNQPLIVKELLLSGADPDLPDKDRGMTALINAAYKGYDEIIETLLPYVNIIDQRDLVFGHTALMEAARSGELNIIKRLIQSGASLHLKNNNGLTALDIAKMRDHHEIVSLLESMQ